MKLASIARTTALAAALSLFAAGPALAASYTVPNTLNPTPQTGSATVGTGSFSDWLNFTVGASYPVVGGAVYDIPVSFTFNSIVTTLYNINNLTVALYNGTDGAGGVHTAAGASGDYQPFSALLSPGTYALKIDGTGAGPAGGMYGWAAVAQPVPEPETWAMLLAGLGAVGFMTRRRKQGKA